MSSFTVEISDETAQALDLLACEYETKRENLIAQVVERFVREGMEFVASLKQAEDDIAAGRTFTQEQVEAMFGVERDRRNAA